MEEVHEYAAALARRKRLPIDVVFTAVVTLPVEVVGRTAYAGRLKEAERRIGKRDPDDVEPPALALHLGVPYGPTTTTSRAPGSPGTRQPRS
jgi:predicted nucleic acid-binding protein